MKKFIFFFIFIPILSSFKAQVYYNWADQFGGGKSQGYSITRDASGNIYTVGTYTGAVDFDPGPSTYTLSGNGGYICKLDANGNFLWAKNCANGNVLFNYIEIDPTGNIIISGHFYGTIDVDPSATVFNLSASAPGGFFISKLDVVGNFLWGKGIAGNSYTRGMDVDVFGNIIFTGAYNGTIDFDPGPSTYTVTNANLQIYVFKLDNNGNFVWFKEMTCTAPGSNFGGGITSDNSANIYYTGYIGPPADMDPGTGSFILSGNFVSKLDINGNFIWANSISDYAGRSIEVDASGNIYSTGNFGGTVDFDWGPGTFTLSANGFGDIYVSKLSNSGNFIWAQQIGGATNDLPVSMSVDPNGNVYTIGMLDFTGNADIVISKVDSVGNLAWIKQIGDINYDTGNDIVVDASANIYATGYFNGIIDCDPTASSYSLSSAPTNTTNAFVLKWSRTVLSTEIKSFSNNNSVSIFPNPTNAMLNIELVASNNSSSYVKVINTLGQVVYQSSINNDQASINIQHLNNGIYFLQLFDKEQLIGTSKIIKE